MDYGGGGYAAACPGYKDIAYNILPECEAMLTALACKLLFINEVNYMEVIHM